MVALDRVYNTPERSRLSSSFRRNTGAHDEAGDEYIFRCEEVDNFCAHSHLRSDSGAEMFAPTVDAKQLCAFAANAQHKGFSCDIHAIILVGNAAHEWRYYGTADTPTGNL